MSILITQCGEKRDIPAYFEYKNGMGGYLYHTTGSGNDCYLRHANAHGDTLSHRYLRVYRHPNTDTRTNRHTDANGNTDTQAHSYTNAYPHTPAVQRSAGTDELSTADLE